jgi:hypothetical protein
MSHGFPLRRSDSPNVRRCASASAGDGADLTFSGDPSRAPRSHLKPCADVARVSTWNCGFHAAHPWRCGAWAAAIPDVLPPRPNTYIPARRSRAKRVLRAKHSELSLREAYGGRRAHCRPPLLCAGPARQFGGAKPLPGSGVLRASETQGRHWKAGHKARGVKHASPPGPRRPQFVAATARRSRRANRPLSRLSGVGGHPGMVRSTGMTEATGPTQA